LDYLGTIKQVNHFGNGCKVMTEIMRSQYDSFIQGKLPIHLTIDLCDIEHGACDGYRVLSRIRQ
jgi:hypothetical protein